MVLPSVIEQRKSLFEFFEIRAPGLFCLLRRAWRGKPLGKMGRKMEKNGERTQVTPV